MPLQPTRWNTLDGAVLNFIDHYDKAVRYRRLHYLFIPPSVSLVRRETDDAALQEDLAADPHVQIGADGRDVVPRDARV